MKILKSRIFFFMLGVLLTSTTAFAVSNIIEDSSEISFDNTGTTLSSTNLEDAITELSSKIGTGGGTHVVQLGTGTSYNIQTLYPDVDYTSLTTANFYYRMGNVSTVKYTYGDQTQNRVDSSFTAPSISYNAETGVLTCGNATIHIWIPDVGNKAYTATTTCYMVY